MPKTARFTLGEKIDGLFVEILEAVVTASYSTPESKLPWLNRAVIKMDVLKVLLQVAWETEVLENKQYAAISEPLDLVGQMLGGWRGQALKQNSPPTSAKLWRGEMK